MHNKCVEEGSQKVKKQYVTPDERPLNPTKTLLGIPWLAVSEPQPIGVERPVPILPFQEEKKRSLFLP